MAAIGEEGRGVLRAARHQIVPQALAMVGFKRGAAGEVGVRLRVSRQKAELDAAFARGGFHLVEAIAPVGRAAQDAEHDELRVAQRLLDIEVDRERMLELQQVGEAERAGCAVMRAGKCREFAVRSGEHHDIGGGLGEIDGFGGTIDHARCRGEEVHQPRSMAAIASRSMCFSPITTSSVPRRSEAFHGRSK
jgi:hypothetical protein